MGRSDFHYKPFDEGTLNKLDLFERYAAEWIPVFISRPDPPDSEIHVFDFFAGPGLDSAGQSGSPLAQSATDSPPEGRQMMSPRILLAPSRTGPIGPGSHA